MRVHAEGGGGGGGGGPLPDVLASTSRRKGSRPKLYPTLYHTVMQFDICRLHLQQAVSCCQLICLLQCNTHCMV